MSLQIKTNIVEINDSTNLEDLLLSNNIRSCFVSGTDNSFKADIIEVKKIPFTDVQAPTISVDLFNTISISKDKLTFLHIVCETEIQQPSDVKNPVPFQVVFDAGGPNSFALGKVSQFQLLELSNFASEINIDSIDLGTDTDKKATLIIVAGGIL